MSVKKQPVNSTEAAFAFAKELVEAGEYPNVSAAVSGELSKAKAELGRERLVLNAVLERRLLLPPDQWDPIGEGTRLTDGARTYLDSLDDTA